MQKIDNRFWLFYTSSMSNLRGSMLKERPVSQAVYERSCHLMPGGVNSPVRAFKGMPISPLIVKEGKGDTLLDVDGHSYIDFCQSWGSLILGHSPDAVVEKVTQQLQKGTSFGIATPYEEELAERIISHVPSMERIRFVSSGTEATMTAIRLARGFTGKSLVIKFDGHFHGHSDGLLVKAGSGVTDLPGASSLGIPKEVAQLTASLPFNDTHTCREFIRSREDIAAVILEPVAGNMGVVKGNEEFLDMLRQETAQRGIVLIFDEVITGFRVGLRGAQGYYGITPDLTCLGKIIGGGLPAAAVGGRKEIMELLAPQGSVYQAGTLSGNPLAMCAGNATLQRIEQPGFYELLDERLTQFLEPIRSLITKRRLPMTIQSVGSMFTFFFGVSKVEGRDDLALLDEERFKDFFTYLFRHGVYLSPSAYEAHFLSSAHTDTHLSYVQNLILSYLETR